MGLPHRTTSFGVLWVGVGFDRSDHVAHSRSLGVCKDQRDLWWPLWLGRRRSRCPFFLWGLWDRPIPECEDNSTWLRRRIYDHSDHRFFARTNAQTGDNLQPREMGKTRHWYWGLEDVSFADRILWSRWIFSPLSGHQVLSDKLRQCSMIGCANQSFYWSD